MRGAGGFIGLPARHVWDRAKNEMELFTEGPGAQRNGNFDIRFLVIFSEIEGGGH